MFSEPELVLLSELVAQYLEIDDLNQREFGEGKSIQEKIDERLEMMNGTLDSHDKFFRN